MQVKLNGIFLYNIHSSDIYKLYILSDIKVILQLSKTPDITFNCGACVYTVILYKLSVVKALRLGLHIYTHA